MAWCRSDDKSLSEPIIAYVRHSASMSETRLKLKSDEFSFANYLFLSCPITFAHSTAARFVQNCKTIRPLKLMSWSTEISRDFSLTFLGGIPYYNGPQDLRQSCVIRKYNW